MNAAFIALVVTLAVGAAFVIVLAVLSWLGRVVGPVDDRRWDRG